MRTLPGMTEPTGNYYAPGHGPHPGQPGYGEPIPAPFPAPPAYGAPQYGAPQYGHPAPPPSGATVITAAIIQIAQSSLYVLGGLAILLIAGVVHGVGDEVDRRSDAEISDTTDSLSQLVAGIGLLLLAGAVFMIVLAALALRGRRWAAITSVVLQSLAAIGGLIGLSTFGAGDSPPAVPLLFVLASIAVAVLFLLPPSTTYFTAHQR